ncbi:MAG TPA: diguanylate cyclase [Steroidobacteraceae bacterium]|nr:diguanylate cyclase [Steroidobacteraceae bacterium]
MAPDTKPADGLADSGVAVQLREGFRWLRFAGGLEQEFRAAHLLALRRQIRHNLLLATGLIVAFAVLDRWLLGTATQARSDLLRFGVILPLIGVTLAATYLSGYAQWYPRIVRVCAPICGLCVVAIVAGATQAGTQLVFATLVITTIFLYFLVGMMFYAALTSNVIVWAAYVATALLSDMSAREITYSSMLLALANLVGAVVCYHLETANRVGYLEARLLGDAAARDGLTGIYNRRSFDDRIEQLWNQAIREQTSVALLLLDIDFFKPFNDFYGHQAGDETLRSVAAALNRFARRPLDFTARYGGEEFALVVYDVDQAFVADLAHRARAAIEAIAIAHERSTVATVLTASIGAACVRPAAARRYAGLIQLADEALYTAKRQGRNRVVVMAAEYADLKTGAFRASGKS